VNDPSIVELVQSQVDAYNAHDLDAFTAAYADDVLITDADGEVLVSGIDQLRESYAERFANPDLRCILIGRMIMGRWVIDHEHVTGHPDGTIQAIACYEVRDGAIVRVRMLRP
jgi:hypothetical protein